MSRNGPHLTLCCGCNMKYMCFPDRPRYKVKPGDVAGAAKTPATSVGPKLNFEAPHIDDPVRKARTSILTQTVRFY